MNSCCDCVHAHWGFTGVEYAKCDKVISPVDGSPDIYCQSFRKYNRADYCGMEGKFFEPRPIKPPSQFMQACSAVLRLLVTGKQKGDKDEAQ